MVDSRCEEQTERGSFISPKTWRQKNGPTLPSGRALAQGKLSGGHYGLVHLGFAGLHIGIGPPSEGSIGAANAEHAPTTPTIRTNTLIAYFIIYQFLLVGSPGSGHRDATDSSNDYFSNTTVFTVDGLAKLVVCAPRLSNL